MPGYRMPSQEELAKSGDFKLLPEDEYLVEVKGIEVQKDQKNPFEPEKPPRDTLMIRFKVISFSNKEPVIYDDGTEPGEADEVRLNGFVDPQRVGLKPRPSIARKFFAAAMNVPIDETIEIEDLNELIGKRMYARTEHRTSQAGQVRDRVVDYRAVRSRPTPKKVEEKSVEDQKAEAESLVATASKIFDGEEAKF